MRRLLAVVVFAAALAGSASATEPPIPGLDDPICVLDRCVDPCEAGIWCGPHIGDTCADEQTTQYRVCLPTGDDFPADLFQDGIHLP